MDGFRPTGIFKPTERPQASPETQLFLEGEDWVLPTDIPSHDAAVEAFVKLIKDNGWGEDEFFLRLAGSEAIMNGMGHGNLGLKKSDDTSKNFGQMITDEIERYPEKRNKKILATVRVTPEEIYFRVKDEGPGFKREDVPDPSDPKRMMKTHGRGLAYMEHAFDTVERIPPGNDVIMRKKKKVQPEGEVESK